MKLRIAAAAPEFRLGTDKKASVLDLIRRAKAEEAAVLTLPAPVFGAADEELLARVRELADGMPVYPLTGRR